MEDLHGGACGQCSKVLRAHKCISDSPTVWALKGLPSVPPLDQAFLAHFDGLQGCTTTVGGTTVC